MKVKKSEYHGAFYPDDAVELRNLVCQYIDCADDKAYYKDVRAVIVPHAGYIYSGMVAGYSYKTLKKKQIKRMIIIGPSHHNYFKGVAVMDYDFFETSLGRIKLFMPNKEHNGQFIFDDKLVQKEHSVEVQIPFVQILDERIEAMVLISGDVSDTGQYAKILSGYLDDNTVLVVSSDLSHYHPYDEANSTDNETLEKILLFDSSVSSDQACGAEGINILLEIAKLRHWQPMLLDYRNSGDTAGDKTHVVGYAAIAFTD